MSKFYDVVLFHKAVEQVFAPLLSRTCCELIFLWVSLNSPNKPIMFLQVQESKICTYRKSSIKPPPPSPFSDLVSKIHTHLQAWLNLACSSWLSDIEETTQFPPVLFSRFLNPSAPFSGPNYLGPWNTLGLIRQKLCHH